MPDDASPEQLRTAIGYDELWGLPATDIHIWRKDRFDSRVSLQSSLPATILREGKLLYAA
jgi:hypothetical protein